MSVHERRGRYSAAEIDFLSTLAFALSEAGVWQVPLGPEIYPAFHDISYLARLHCDEIRLGDGVGCLHHFQFVLTFVLEWGTRETTYLYLPRWWTGGSIERALDKSDYATLCRDIARGMAEEYLHQEVPPTGQDARVRGLTKTSGE